MILRRDIFQALADPTRRSIILLLASQTITAGAIADNFDNARSTISKHIQILTECGLVKSNQQGREIYYQLDIGRVTEIDRWLQQLREVQEDRFDNLEKYLEKLQTSKPLKMNTTEGQQGIQEEKFIITRSFEADTETLFNMWINPKHFSSWLGPAGAKMWFTSIEVKEGGVSQWAMTTEDALTKYGQLNFKIINPNYLLVYTQNFCDRNGKFAKAPFTDTYPDYLLTTVKFIKENGNKTNITVTWEIFGEAKDIERQTFLELIPVMKIGWGASFDKLEAMLASKSD